MNILYWVNLIVTSFRPVKTTIVLEGRSVAGLGVVLERHLLEHGSGVVSCRVGVGDVRPIKNIVFDSVARGRRQFRGILEIYRLVPEEERGGLESLGAPAWLQLSPVGGKGRATELVAENRYGLEPEK